MSEERSLDVAAVRERVKDNDDALKKIRKRLRALAAAEEESKDAAGSLRDSATSLSEILAVLDNHVRSLDANQAALESGTKAFEDHIAASDPAAVTRAITSSQKALEARVENIEATLDLIHSEVRGIAGSAQQRAADAEAEVAKLRTLIDGLPQRVRSKHGL